MADDDSLPGHLCAGLDRDWEAFYRVETTETLLRHAAGLAERFAQRENDSVHLAAAMNRAIRLSRARPRLSAIGSGIVSG